ncbi:DNA bridging protein [Mycobacterium phage LadyBird]|uniref:nucloid associated Lsr2-like n=1 Tax=Mycobacterium phage LadyBird TaxID=1718166 RepID=UPI0006CE4020|nr:nucloid associated Lsr2-like [Mycobacterium phage LadyBird]ALF02173.1 DNA bridging protein [Mycobacterium phage LadyBird]
MKMTDDFDHSKPADVTRVLGWEGYDYTLDLSKSNDKELVKLLQPYLDAAHEKVKQRKAREKPSRNSRVYPTVSVGKEERQAIREWARDNGMEIGDKGIISKRIVAAYTEAHSG